MRGLFVFILLSVSVPAYSEYAHIETRFRADKRWYQAKNPKQSLKHLFKILIRSKSGKELVKMANAKAKASDQTLYDVVKPGSGSLTDTTLVRKFSPSNLEKITYETKSIVYINTELNQYDALFDLAHELTHFVYRRGFNPYELGFTLKDFITNTIEGEGGEVQAFMTECKVQAELFPGKNSRRFNCQKIINPDTNKISYEQAVKNFYRVGKYFESFNSMLEEHGIRHYFPKVSSQKENFVSSAYGIPYPVAAFEEYLTVMNKVCENDKRRLKYFKEQEGRAPASFAESYQSRCKGLFN